MLSWHVVNIHSHMIAFRVVVVVTPSVLSAIFFDHIELVAIFNFGKMPFLKDLMIVTSFI
jgi:hypothetical protein